jgi:hypothetical protein
MTRRIFYTAVLIIVLPLFGFTCSRRASQDAGVFKSTDGGETWEQKVKIDEKNNIAGVSVNEIKIDRVDSNVVFIGSLENGIYRSSDGGETWSSTALNVGDIYSIVINPEDNSVLYAAGSVGDIGKIFKSSDGGNNWEEVYSETHEGVTVYTVEIDWFDPRRIYAGTGGGAVLKSKDSGRSWVVTKWFDHQVNKVVISPEDSRVLFISTNKELYRSNNSAKDFFSLEKSLEEFGTLENIHDLVVHPKEADLVYLSSELGLLKSDNGGRSWQQVNLLAKPEPYSVSKITLDYSNLNKIYFGFDSNFYKSDDQGQSWAVRQFTSGEIGKISVDPHDGSVMYVGVVIKR